MTERNKNMDARATVIIPLMFPVQLADRRLTEVTIRRPVMRDLLKHPLGRDSGVAEDMAFMGALTGLVPEELEQLDVLDYEALQTQVLRFRGAAVSVGRPQDVPSAGASGGNDAQ